jgi:hypothetical protein
MPEEPIIIVQQPPVVAPTEKKGIGSILGVFIVLILLGVGFLAWWYLTQGTTPGQDCTGKRKPVWEFCTGQETKKTGTLNCCTCPTWFGESDVYECGHG